MEFFFGVQSKSKANHAGGQYAGMAVVEIGGSFGGIVGTMTGMPTNVQGTQIYCSNHK